MGLDIWHEEISIAQRLSKKTGSATVKSEELPLIVVHFSNLKARETMYRSGRLLKDIHDTKFFINEDLCAEVYSLHRTSTGEKKEADGWMIGRMVVF